MTTLFLVG